MQEPEQQPQPLFFTINFANRKFDFLVQEIPAFPADWKKPSLFAPIRLASANAAFGSAAIGNIKSGTCAILKDVLTIKILEKVR